jgi:hypothetical protein
MTSAPLIPMRRALPTQRCNSSIANVTAALAKALLPMRMVLLRHSRMACLSQVGGRESHSPNLAGGPNRRQFCPPQRTESPSRNLVQYRYRQTSLLAGQSFDLPMRDHKQSGSPDAIHAVTADARLARVGRQMKMLVDGHNDHATADPSLLRIVARAHEIQSRLIRNTQLSVHDIARQERVSAAYIYILLRLAWLAPDITTAIVNGRQPLQLNAMKLMRFTSQLSSDWAQQRALLGFR